MDQLMGNQLLTAVGARTVLTIMKKDIELLNRKLTGYLSDILKKDKTIEELNSQVSSQKKEITQLKAQSTRLKNEKSDLKKQIQELQKELDEMKKPKKD